MDAENGAQLRSRLVKVLNVAQGYACGFDFGCGLVGLTVLDIHVGLIKKMRAILIGLMLAIIPSTGSAEVIREGPRECKAVALTFDMCPVREGSGYDELLVRTLTEKHIPATFFLSGRWIAKHDAEVKALLAVPFFEVGTHGHVHAHLPELDENQQRREILEPVTVLRAKYGRTAPLFRPPYGEYNEATVHLVETLGLRFILWNVVSGDPDSRLSEAEIVHAVKSRVRGGSIVVMHANGKGRHTREVVDDLYEDLIVRQGYQPVTISTLLNECASPRGHDGRAPHH